MDYAAVLDAISFSEVAALILPAAGALVTLYVLIKGCRIVMGFVRGESDDYGEREPWSMETYHKDRMWQLKGDLLQKRHGVESEQYKNWLREDTER